MTAFKPEIIAAYRAALALHRDPLASHYEEDGGKREEYGQARVDLHLLLGRQPWEVDLFDTIDSDQPPTWVHREHVPDWLAARAIRIVLDQAIAE